MFTRSLLGCARLTCQAAAMPIQPIICPLLANRSASSTPVCKEDEGPRCGPRRLAKSDCIKKKKKQMEDPKDAFQFKALLYKPECCEDDCPDVLPRFDDLYYKISDKTKIKYDRTWVECKSPLIKRKKVCIIEGIRKPQHPKRKFARKVKKCQVSKNAWKLGLMDCKKVGVSKCPRFIMKGCKAARTPSICANYRPPSDCKKRCTPFPAFSECDRDALRKGKPVECFCLGGATNCEIVLYLLEQQRLAKAIKK